MQIIFLTLCTQLTTVLGWTFNFLICIYPWFSQYTLSRHDYKYNVEEAATYAAYAPILWAMYIISIIFLCHKNRGGSFASLAFFSKSNNIMDLSHRSFRNAFKMARISSVYQNFLCRLSDTVSSVLL